MGDRGFSLVEMVVILGIMSILLAFGTLRFNDYSNRYRSENQIRMIYTELMKARSNAIYQRRTVRVKVTPEVFEVYSSERDDTAGAAPVLRQQLRFRLVTNWTGDYVDFDDRGMANIDGTLCVDTTDETGAVDSVVIKDFRVRAGKKAPGKDCHAENITTR